MKKERSLVLGIMIAASLLLTIGCDLEGSNDDADDGSPYVGMPYQGGIIAYIFQPGDPDDDPGYVAGEIHGLIAATEDQSTGIAWITGGNTTTTSVPSGTETALGTGSANTDHIIAQAVAAGTTDQLTYAAGIARAYSGGGHIDWYLPSQDELNKLYLNKTAIDGLTDGTYWSSSEYAAISAWVQFFNSSNQNANQKVSTYRVRAVRTF